MTWRISGDQQPTSRPPVPQAELPVETDVVVEVNTCLKDGVPVNHTRHPHEQCLAEQHAARTGIRLDSHTRADLDNRLAPQQASQPSEEGIGSVIEGALAGGFSDNDSWSAVGGQTVIGLVPIAGQIADIRDIAAAGRDVWNGEDGGWAGLGIAAIAVIPGLDFLKGGSRAGRKLLAETAERGLSEVSQEALQQLSTKLSKEGLERANKELITLSVAREEMLTRLDDLANDTSLSQSTRDKLDKAVNALQKNLNQDDLVGALRDKHGLTVVKHGRTWNHLEEVAGGLNSLSNARTEMLKDLKQLIPGTSEYQLLSKEVEAIAETVRRMQSYTEIK